jgi:hypothetical protein
MNGELGFAAEDADKSMTTYVYALKSARFVPFATPEKSRKRRWRSAAIPSAGWVNWGIFRNVEAVVRKKKRARKLGAYEPLEGL